MFRLRLGALMVLPMFGIAQNIGANLQGNVVDVQGAALEGAAVQIVSKELGVELKRQTTASGAFQAVSLAPGRYQITALKESFEPVTLELMLTVGESRQVRIVLPVAGAAQKITVESGVLGVQLTSPEKGASYDAKLMQDLPMLSSGVGRNFRTQVYLTPGVAPATQAHRPFSVAGARSRNNNYLLDSNDYNEIEGGLLMGRGSSEQLISTEALEAVQVLSHNYKAEYGRQNGAIISMVTKRGTNDWRGLAYHYLRNDLLEARNTFDRTRPPLRFNQGGGNFGGPIAKNRTFVFGNFEAFIRRTTSATTIQTLTAADRARITNPAIAPLAALYPEPNLPGTNLFRAQPRSGGEQYSFVARVDHEISSTQRIFSRSTYLLSNTLNNAGAALQRSNTRTLPQGHSLHHVWTPDARTVNEARFNYTRYSLNDQWLDPVELGNPAVNGLVGQVNVNGLSALGQFAFMRRQQVQNNFQYTDDLSRVHGRHALKAGLAVRRLQLNSGTITPGFTGVLRFNSVNDFLAGRAASYNRNVGNPYIGQRATETNVYVQDDWQIHPRLMLNLGLRYEYNTVPVEVNNLIDPRYTFRPDRNNFAPRIGLAWRLDQNGKTALRAGYGLFYNVLELSFVGLTRFNPPLIGNIVNAAPTFPDLAGTAARALPSGLVIPDPAARQPYAQHLHLTLERQIADRTTASVAYVGTLGRKLPRAIRPNGGDALTAAQRPDPTVGVVNRLETGALSNYHSLEMSLNTQRRDFNLRFSYTFAKFIDEVSDFPNTNQNIDRGLLALDERNWRLNRGISDLQVRHNVAVAYTYDLPWKRKHPVIGGWSVQGITTLLSGRPYTLYAGTDNLFGTNNNRILDLPGTLLRQGGSERAAILLTGPEARARITPARGTLGRLGRNTEFGDGLFTFNSSLFKTIGLGERVRLQVRAEAFNLFNTVNYNLPDGVLTSPNFGQAVTALEPRQVQLALRINF